MRFFGPAASPAAIVVRWPDLAIDRSPTARLSVRLQEKRRDDGRPLDLADKQKRLYERYRNRPKPGAR